MLILLVDFKSDERQFHILAPRKIDIFGSDLLCPLNDLVLSTNSSQSQVDKHKECLGASVLLNESVFVFFLTRESL